MAAIDPAGVTRRPPRPPVGMGNTISKSTFISELGKAPIDVARISPSLAKALEAQGVLPADLEGVAGKDGKISGHKELAQLFGFVDGFEASGPKSSFVAQDDQGQPTRSGAVYDSLKAEVASARAVANASLTPAGYTKSISSAASHPIIDTHNMSPELSAAFKSANIDPKAAAGLDGRIRRPADWERLQGLLDAADGAADGRASGLVRDATGAVADSPIAALNGAIDAEIKSNASKPEYAQPGTKPAPTQPRLVVDTNALTVAEADRKPPVKLGVTHKFQFDLYPGNPEKGEKACFEAATQQTETYNAKAFKGKDKPVLAGGSQAIQVAYAEDKSGRVAVDSTQAKLARDYVDEQLDKGRPVMLGVSYDDNKYNTDKMTDHFITVNGRGYDADGRLYYTYKDPGAGKSAQDGKLYVDKDTGKMFKEGDLKGPYVQNSDYEVTQVRTYKN